MLQAPPSERPGALSSSHLRVFSEAWKFSALTKPQFTCFAAGAFAVLSESPLPKPGAWRLSKSFVVLALLWGRGSNSESRCL